MAKRHVPAHNIYTCDRCGKDGVPSESGAFQYSYATVSFQRTSMSFAQADSDHTPVEYELCGQCSQAFDGFINPARPAQPSPQTGGDT